MPFMQRLTWQGVALHGGDLPGYPASHGCIRLPREFAKKLYSLTTRGTTVIVVDEKRSEPTIAAHPGILFSSSDDACGHLPSARERVRMESGAKPGGTDHDPGEWRRRDDLRVSQWNSDRSRRARDRQSGATIRRSCLHHVGRSERQAERVCPGSSGARVDGSANRRQHHARGSRAPCPRRRRNSRRRFTTSSCPERPLLSPTLRRSALHQRLAPFS